MADHSKHPKETSPWKLGGLSLVQLGKKTYATMNKDDAFDVAAALGYWFILALFPMLIFLVSLLTMVSSASLIDSLMAKIGTTMPADAYNLLAQQMQHVMQQSKGGLLTFGILGTIWAASSGVSSLMDGLNKAYEVTETRSFVKKRLLSILLTLGLALLTVLGAALLVASDQVGKVLYDWTGQAWAQTVGGIFSFILGLALMFVGLEVMFYFGPNVKNQKWSWISPGSLIGVVIFVIISFAFSLYLRFSNTYNATYGTLGGVILLMLWLYNLGLSIVIGGEVNSTIAKAARARGDERAPEVGQEREPKESGKAQKAETDHNVTPSGERRPYRRPVGYQPQIAYSYDDSHLSLQAKRRMAMRRIRRNEMVIEDRTMHPQGWAILKRPLVSLVYLGSIGFYLYQSITKHLNDGSQSAASS